MPSGCGRRRQVAQQVVERVRPPEWLVRIENGVTVLRPTRLGTSQAIDPLGRILGSADYFVGDDQMMLATFPTAGVRTAYSLVGDDVVAWMSVAAVIVGGGALGLSALRRQTRRRRARG
jgi:apolipoprotein N-acyltransferase